MPAKLKWGILGTGGIARALGNAINASSTGELVAVGSRKIESAKQFGEQFKVPRCYGSYAELVADKSVQVIYNSLPNHMHAEWTIRCAQAGKHILCEKPLTSNYPEAMALIEAVQHYDVFMLEAFMYRCHPQTTRIVELVKSKIIGKVRLIQVNFSFNFGEQPDNIRSKISMSGGGIMDVGCYTMSFARLVAGAALDLDGAAEPLEVKGTGHLHPQSGVDMWAVSSVKFPSDILATLTCGMQISVPTPTTIYGTQGRIVVHHPWFPGETKETAKIDVFVNGKKRPMIVTTPGYAGLYTIEVDKVAKYIKQRQVPSPAMTWTDSLGNMKALDTWRESIGLVFDCEKPEGLTRPVSQQKLAIRKDARIPTGKIEGVHRPVSRLVMGTMYHVVGNLAKTCAMLDHYVERGGNILDTARVYGTEANVGQWLKLRGIRDKLVIIGKGAHGSPDNPCTPKMITDDLLQSLEQLQTDHLDVYLMHRDNLAVPVGEFVEMLNEHKQAGRIDAFGGSNWSLKRLQAANDYARKHKLTPFTASSPCFTLAEWNEPMWGGCTAARDDASRAWHEQTGVALLSWSSQANGFFSGRFKEEDRENPAIASIVRVWFNEGNFERLRRVQSLAKQKGVAPVQIALAYVLCQKMNIFALIGPESLEEMRVSLDASKIKLTTKERAWLNLEGK